VGGRVGYRTPSCVQVLVSGAEDLARTACSTFPQSAYVVEAPTTYQFIRELNAIGII
jgi:hypothetical protein